MCIAGPYSFLVNDTTLPSDNPLMFRKTRLEKILKIIYNKSMTIEDQIRDGKLRYDINSKAAKKRALSSGKVDTYENVINSK